MTSKFQAAMRRAAGATRAFNLMGATRIIQKALGANMLSRFTTSGDGAAKPDKAVALLAGKTGSREQAPADQQALADQQTPADQPQTAKRGSTARVPARLRRPLGEVIETLRKAPQAKSVKTITRKSEKHAKPRNDRFTQRTHTSHAGTRAYKLYVPASASEGLKGLVLMLHGCTQNPDDFAVGTKMNTLAESHGLIIVYPAQTGRDNAASCWNWFESGHQLRDAGEPAILGSLTLKLIKEFDVPPDRIFVAGLSAGAAMAVIMGKAYPELFSAVGVHSGLAYQSAGNVMSAMAVMRGKKGSTLFSKPQTANHADSTVRTIVFQGTADGTVHPSNAQRIVDMAASTKMKRRTETVSGSANGRPYKQTIIAAENGVPFVESWLIDGAGHAWSGGNASGSYADPKGPDASVEMIRFFLMQP